MEAREMNRKFVMIDFGTVRNRLEDHGDLSLELEARKRACRGRAIILQDLE